MKSADEQSAERLAAEICCEHCGNSLEQSRLVQDYRRLRDSHAQGPAGLELPPAPIGSRNASYRAGWRDAWAEAYARQAPQPQECRSCGKPLIAQAIQVGRGLCLVCLDEQPTAEGPKPCKWCGSEHHASIEPCPLAAPPAEPAPETLSAAERCALEIAYEMFGEDGPSALKDLEGIISKHFPAPSGNEARPRCPNPDCGSHKLWIFWHENRIGCDGCNSSYYCLHMADFAQFFPAPADDAVRALREALEDANSLCRSAHSIAERKGLQTNWEAFTKHLKESLERQHKILYGRALGKEQGAEGHIHEEER